jgi:hypothetical protein
MREGVGAVLIGAREKIVAGEQAKRAIPLHRAEPTRVAVQVDDRERQAPRAAIRPRVHGVTREASERPEAPAERRDWQNGCRYLASAAIDMMVVTRRAFARPSPSAR